MSTRPVPEKFLVSFAFAGEQRELVRPVAEAVEQILGYGTVFYDEWYEHYIAGDDADLRLQSIYTKRSVLVVPCISGQIDKMRRTKEEIRSIRALEFRLAASQDENDSYRLLPLRVGDGDIQGIFENMICPDIRNRPAAKTAELIVNRLRLIEPNAGSLNASDIETPPHRTKTGRRHKVYFCYRNVDRPAVEALAHKLKALGDIDPWLDIWNLIDGQQWLEGIEQGYARLHLLRDLHPPARGGILERPGGRGSAPTEG